MKHHHSIKKASALYSISVIAFFLALHTSIPTYFNSSFLSGITDAKTVSIVYLIISLTTIVGLLSMDSVLHRFGNLNTSIAFILVQIFVFYGLITSTSSNILLFLFIIASSMIGLIGFTIDIFLQKGTDLGHTGGIRGMVMTATNSAWILGPLLGGMLVIGDSYRGIYIAGFALLFPLIYLVHRNFKDFKDSHYVQVSARQTFLKILRDKDISKIFIINIVLQTFYAWMVVYTPMYLHEYIKFDWSEISVIFTIMLIPFVLVQLPLGKLADKKWGEKELLAIGFTIIGITTVSLVFFDTKSIMIWSIALFLTRIGAATAEIMIETYFFKKTDKRDPEVLSMFRVTRPLSYFIAPIITTVGLSYTTQPYLFVILGVICLLTLYPILNIRDTN